jgi:hypothetical protein
METQHQIKDRLFKTASSLWGLPRNQAEQNFDPLVGLLFGACATELEKISNDIETSRGRALERIVKLLYPEVLTQALPAHAICYAYPTEKTAQIHNEVQMYCEKRFPGKTETSQPIWKNIYFSPAGKYNLLQKQIKVIATQFNLYEVKDIIGKTAVKQVDPYYVEQRPTNTIWIALDQSTNTEQDCTFYFDVKNESNHDIFFDYLPKATWYINNVPLQVKRGYGKQLNISNTINPAEIVHGKTSVIKKTQKHVNNFYKKQFITVTLPNLKNEFTETPEILETTFDKDSNAQKLLNEKYVWVRIDLPDNINIKDIQDDIYINLNCFPVINKHLMSAQHKVLDHLNIFPLISEELFLDLAEILDVEGNDLMGFSQNEINDKIALHYSGVERFTERNAVAAVENLIQHLRDESAAFSNIGNEFLQGELKTLQQSINKLELQINEKQLTKGDVPYLILGSKEKMGSTNIFIKYWTTNGGEANNIKPGTELSLSQNTDVQSNAVMILTKTSGGRNELGQKDKVLAYKSAILSKEKLVTNEDIMAFCKLRLSVQQANVDITKGYQVNVSNVAGFSKTIDIKIEMEEDVLEELTERGTKQFWEDDLKMSVAEHSNFFMPIRVFIKTIN